MRITSIAEGRCNRVRIFTLSLFLCGLFATTVFGGERGGGLFDVAGDILDVAVGTAGKATGAASEVETVDILFAMIGDLEAIPIQALGAPLTASERKRLGETTHKEFRDRVFSGKVKRPDGRRDRELMEVWDKLNLRRHDGSFSLYIVETPTINAFTHVGGYIYVHRGFLDLFKDNLDVLAFVLAHEAAHVLSRDTDTIFMIAKGSSSFAPLLSDPLLPGSVAKALATGYGQKREYAADRRGWELAEEAGYSRRRMAKLFEILAVLEDAEEAPGDVAGRLAYRIENHFSTHPPTLERKARLVSGR